MYLKTTWPYLLAQRGRLALLAGRVVLGGIFMYAARPEGPFGVRTSMTGAGGTVRLQWTTFHI